MSELTAWVKDNFAHMGPAYSAYNLPELPGLIWESRFERFVLYGNPQPHIKSISNIIKLISALGCNKFDTPSKLEIAFCRLRDAWFDRVLKIYSSERCWESEEQEKLRTEHNQKMKDKYNEDTISILNGNDCKDFHLAPTCFHDLYK